MDAGCPLLIGVLHATKGGDYRGPTSFVHECDIVLRVEDGAWTTEKNRFGASGVGGGIRGISTAEAGAAAAPPDHFATAQEPE
jgi:predicted ATP-dependent serine protease